jgi:anti-anti-sigma factor
MEELGRTSMPECPLRISATVAAGQMVVELDGEVDIETVPVLQAGMEVIDAEGAADVLIDLGRVTFLSPHGLSVLVQCAHRLERQSRWAEFRRPTAQVRRMLEWTGGPLRVAKD